MIESDSTRSLARILIVDDSAFMRTALARMINRRPGSKSLERRARGRTL